VAVAFAHRWRTYKSQREMERTDSGS
jgi:hypothetical protein